MSLTSVDVGAAAPDPHLGQSVDVQLEGVEEAGGDRVVHGVVVKTIA